MFLSVQLVGFWKNVVRTCVSYTRENRNTLCVVVFLGGFMSELFMKGNKSEMWRVKEYLKPCSNNQCAFKKTSLAPNRDSMCQSYIFLWLPGRVSSLTLTKANTRVLFLTLKWFSAVFINDCNGSFRIKWTPLCSLSALCWMLIVVFLFFLAFSRIISDFLLREMQHRKRESS